MEVSGEGEWILERGGGCAAPPFREKSPLLLRGSFSRGSLLLQGEG